MFNLKRAKTKTSSESSKIAPEEKALEKNRESLDNVASDDPSVHESLLKKDRKGNLYETTEGRMDRKKADMPEEIAEKRMKREKIGELYMPAINTFVEKIVQKRRKNFTSREEKKGGNWTLDPPTQNGALPKWPKVVQRRDKTNLNNDINRNFDREPLIGGKIVKASIDDTVVAIKSGATKPYDEKIVSILKRADNESRDLTKEEKNKINELKKARTHEYLRKSQTV